MNSPEHASAKQTAIALFQKNFGTAPFSCVQAPGRLEILGNHTDYNEGLVMSVAVDRFVFLAAGKRNDGKIEIVTTAFPERESFFADRIEKNPDAPWANYIKGVFVELRQRGVHFTGFNFAIHGTIPLGAGMSSSAALEVASALGVRELFPFSITENGVGQPPIRTAQGNLPPLRLHEKLTFARLCQAAESRFVGVNCGLLDQISSLCGRTSQVIQIDCRLGTVEYDPLPAEVSLIVCDSGIKHDLASGDYNALRRHCESAARALGATSLRSVDGGLLGTNKHRLNQRDYECAYHIVGENQRVTHGARALREGDMEQFGQYLWQSHESSRDFFKNSCPELDILVELARAHPGCLGARLTGGGFGGATINLVHRELADDFCKTMAQAYAARTGREMRPMAVQVVDGAH